jgi:hypothetical protein
MPKIQADPFVQRAMETKGITSTVGVFGNHKIQFGTASSINLASIKANSVPFAGFKTATKITRGQEGLRQTTEAALTVLSRPDGRFQAKELLGALKASQIHLHRLDLLGKIPDAQRKDPALWAFAPTVEKLSNAQLAAVYQTFASGEMELLQTALEREGQVNAKGIDARATALQLFSLQALVLKEVSNRVARGENMPGANTLPTLSTEFGATHPDDVHHSHDLTHANLRTLVEVGAQSATHREKTAQNVSHNLESRNLPGLSARAMGDILRSAELTVNIDLNFLIGDDSAIAHPDQPMKNIFHLAEQGKKPKGDDYLVRRDAAERLLFPEMDGHDVNPDERPMYGALNVSRRRVGATPLTAGYGTAAIVLKPNVAQRATYVAEDTFYSPVINMGTERREAFYKLLDQLVGKGFEKEFVEECRNPDSLKHKELEKWFDKLSAVPNCRLDEFSHPPTVLALTDRSNERNLDVFVAHLTQVFGDKTATRSNMTTFDNLEALIPNMATVTSNAIAHAVQLSTNGSAPRIHLGGIQYIEAQIQGPIVPRRDIAEIRIDLGDVPKNAQPELKKRMEAFERETGIHVNLIEDYDYTEEVNEISKILDSNRTHNTQHLDPSKIDDAVKSITKDMSASLAQLISENESLRPMLSLLQGQQALQGNALAKLERKFEDAWKESKANPDPGISNEKDLVAKAFKKAALPLLELKGKLLREIEVLEFDTSAQKAAFTTWVLSAGALRSPEELRIIQINAMRQKEVLTELINTQPTPSAGEVLRRIAVVTSHASAELGDFIKGLDKDIEFGADDKAAELDRISFMSLALLQHVENPGDSLERIRNLLIRPEQRQLAGQITRVLQEPGIEKTADFGKLNATHMLMGRNVTNISRLTGHQDQVAQPFYGELSLLPQKTRDTLHQVSPELTKRLNNDHPPYASFPIPAEQERLPKTDSARRDFLVKHLDTYMGHEKTFEKGTSVHGRGHIARAYIFANAMTNILKEQGVDVDRNAVLCGIAGHDMGRAGRGTDYWEGRSAEMTIAAMKIDYGSDSLGSDYENAIGDSIDAHRGKTLEAYLLNAADSLDIGRTAQFDPDKFAFLHGKPGEVPTSEAKRIRVQLEKEADLLQRLTNPLCMHRNILEDVNKEFSDAAINDNTQALETLSQQKKTLLKIISDRFEAEWQVPSQEFVQGIESQIANNRDLFPILSKYYQI